MTDGKQHSVIKRWGKRLLWTFLGIVILLITIRLSLKTAIVHNWVKNAIVSTANDQLNGSLHIDTLSGDLWKTVSLSGVRLDLDNTDTLATVDSVRTTYNIWALLEKRIDVSSLEIYQPQVNVRQEGEAWNFQRMMAETSPTDTTASGTVFSLQIESFDLRDGGISVKSDSLLSGTEISVRDLSLSSSLKYSEEAYSVDLRDLSFQILDSEIGQPLRITSSATAEQNQLTLEKLVLATGNSIVQSSGFVVPEDSTLQFDLSADPISWKDMVRYADQMPIRQDISMNIGLEGNPEKFVFSLNIQADGLESLEMNSHFRWQDEMILEQLSAEITSLDPAILLADTTLPSMRNAQASFNGGIEMGDLKGGRGDFSLSAQGLGYASYEIDRLSASGKLEQGMVTAETQIHSRNQRLAGNINIRQLWSDLPSIEASIRGNNIDPAYWTGDTTTSGNIAFNSKLSGQGWYPDKTSWNYSLSVSESEFMQQPVGDLQIKGKVSASAVSVEGFLKNKDGRIDITANAKDLSGTPSYRYDIQAHEFNAGRVLEMPDFNTSLNTRITGSGSGLNISDLKLTSEVVLDSSVINGELVENLSADISVADTVVTVDNAELKSVFADGSFEGQMNIMQNYNADNELSFNLQLKDLEALAPLVNVEELHARGELNGVLQPVGMNDLQFKGAFDLSDVLYGDLFSTERMQGTLDTRISEKLDYKADLDLSAPVFSGVKLQNVNLTSQGHHLGDRTNGDYHLQFSSPNEGRIEQSGNYTIAGDSVGIRINELNIISDLRVLSLENPFNFIAHGDTVRMDTMRVSSGDGAFLEMAVPVFSEEEQQAYIHGESLNTSVIQNSLVGETFVEGMLSGQMEFTRRDTALTAEGELLLSGVGYEEINLDTLSVGGRIADERLIGSLLIRHDGKQLANGQVDLPFKLGDPKSLPPEFYREPVSGTMDINEISIDRFETLFGEEGITNTTGLFSFRGSLDGEAGSPQFSADTKIREATLSGVSVDSVMAGLLYNHEDRKLDLNASVMSLKQKLAEISADIPFYIDMKTFQVHLPQESDSITANINTNDFNLAALNDFTDRQTIRNITGRLNGMVRIGGSLDNLKTDGQLELQNGGFRLIPAGIQLTNIRTALSFRPSEVRLSSFSAQSGNGKMTASGVIELVELVPGNMDLSVKAQNFRIANTSEYNAIINMDTRARGSVTTPRVTGKLSFVRGFVKLDNFGEQSVESVQLESEEPSAFESNIYDSLALDMDVSFDRRFYIQNERYLELEVELQGQLDLVKNAGEELQLFGTMGAAGGYARPFGKRFNLQEGEVTFSGPPANPKLAIRTRYEPPQTQENVVIWYIIEGTVEEPQFKYESQPPMELENIISYTLFGQPFYALDSWKQVVAGSGNTSASDVALDVLLDRVETLATQRLGIDVVRIENTQSGGESGTQITTGWYLNPKVFFAIQNVITGSTPDTNFLLEYMLQKNLKLMIRQGNDLRQGIDLKWNYEY